MVIRKTVSTLIVSMVACGVAHGANRNANANANAAAAPAANPADAREVLRQAEMARREKARSAANLAGAQRAGNIHGFAPAPAAEPAAAAAPAADQALQAQIAALMEQNRLQAEQLRAQAERERKREEQQAERERRAEERMERMMGMFARQNAHGAAAAPAAEPAPAQNGHAHAAPAPKKSKGLFGKMHQFFYGEDEEPAPAQASAARDVKSQAAAAAAQPTPRPAAAQPARPVAPQPAQKFKMQVSEGIDGFTIKINLTSEAATAIHHAVFANRDHLEKVVAAYLAANPAAQERMMSLQLGNGEAFRMPLLGRTALQAKADIDAAMKMMGGNEVLIGQAIAMGIDDMMSKALKQMQAALGNAGAGVEGVPQQPVQQPAPAQNGDAAQDSDEGSDTDQDEPDAAAQFKGNWQGFRESFVDKETLRRMKAANRTVDKGAKGLAFFTGVWLKAFSKAVDAGDMLPKMPYESEPDSDDDSGKPKKKDPFADLNAAMDANNKKKPDDKKKDDKKKDGGADSKHNGNPAAKK